MYTIGWGTAEVTNADVNNTRKYQSYQYSPPMDVSVNDFYQRLLKRQCLWGGGGGGEGGRRSTLPNV